MKKNKSTSFIKVPSLTASSKKSAIQELQCPNWPRLTVTKSTSLLPTIPINKIYYHEQQTSDTATPADCQYLMTVSARPQRILKQKLSTLHSQIEILQQQINDSKTNGKNKSKDYQSQLKRYQQVAKDIKNNQNLIELQKNKVITIKNNISMLQQDYHSTQVNFQQSLAQKQYCDQILQQYEREYQNQAQLVLLMLAKQTNILEDRKKLENTEQQINTKQKALADWKKQIEFDLQQKVIKNKITQFRIDLMKIQEQTNSYADQHKLLKIRQILCLQVKQQIQSRRLILTAQQLNQEGMQIFVCRNGTINQFQQAVFDYRGKDKSKYDVKMVQKYFTVLQKIQASINNPKFKLNRKINKEHCDQITNLRKTLFKLQQQIKQNQKQISAIQEKLEVVFANQSVAIIEHLRETNGRYELHEIKTTLKKLKQQQKSRTAKIKQIYRKYSGKNDFNFRSTHVDFMNKLTEFNEILKKQQNIVKSMQNEVRKLLNQKQKLQNDISLGVSKWNQISLKKQELKKLYKDLNQLNKQIRQAERLVHTQRQFTTASKNLQNSLPYKRSYALDNTLKQTMKLRIQGNLSKKKDNYKQNEYKISNLNIGKQSKSRLILEQACKTRKPSLTSLTKMKSSKILQINDHYKQSSRDILTAVLMSKLGN